MASTPAENSRGEDRKDETNESSVPLSRLERFYSTSTKEYNLSDQVLEIIKIAFSKQPRKEIWLDLMGKYLPIKNTKDILVASTMKTGTKNFIRQMFSSYKTKKITLNI